MKTTFPILILLLSLFATAQTIDKPTFSNAGGTMANSDVSIAFTIGEPLVGLIKNGNAIGQGFWANIAAENTLEAANFKLDNGIMSVYPNPFSDYLNIKLNQDEGFIASIYSISGQLLFHKIIENPGLENRINVCNLSQGLYLLSISIPGKKVKRTIKILKK